MTAGITAAGVAAAAAVASTAYTISQSGKGGGAASILPSLEKPSQLPTPSGIDKAKRASIAEQLRRRGRAGTILTDLTADTLGGG